MSEQPTPAHEHDEAEGAELLRVWVAHEEMHCDLQPNAFDDPGTWGVVLAEVIRHVADSLSEEEGLDPATTIARIREALDADLRAPADAQPQE